jgi:hypothetical protein
MTYVDKAGRQDSVHVCSAEISKEGIKGFPEDEYSDGISNQAYLTYVAPLEYEIEDLEDDLGEERSN